MKNASEPRILFNQEASVIFNMKIRRLQGDLNSLLQTLYIERLNPGEHRHHTPRDQLNLWKLSREAYGLFSQNNARKRCLEINY